jgi:hypothetical protein
MKKFLFLFPVLFLFCSTFQVRAQSASPRKGHGAATVQELGQAVFNALQQNQFSSLENFLPDDTDLKALRRKSSEDMRLVLERTTPDTVRQNLQKQFSFMMDRASAGMFNWSAWTLAATKATRQDPKNPFLYKVRVAIADAAANEKYVLFEAFQIRNRYFLFKQLDFTSEI